MISKEKVLLITCGKIPSNQWNALLKLLCYEYHYSPPSLPPSLPSPLLLPLSPSLLSLSFSLPPSLHSLPSSIPFETIRFYYPQWSERENWLIFKANLSPKSRRPRPPKLVCMHMMSIPTCMNFLSRFRFFNDHGL